MLGKLVSLLASTKGSGSKRCQDAERIKAFYANLEKGVNKLENSMGSEVPCSNLKNLSDALEFISSLHVGLHSLVEDLWIRVRSVTGADVVLNLYLEVNKKLLETCNHLKEGARLLESCEMSLEHAVDSLACAVECLPFRDEEHEALLLSSLRACKSDLKEMESTNCAPAGWDEFISKFGQGYLGQTGEQVANDMKKRELALKRSVTVLPSRTLSEKAFDISLVLMDAELVIIFISNLLLWVLTDSTRKFKCELNLEKGQAIWKNGQVNWSTSLRRLRDKVHDAESMEDDKDTYHVNSVREFERLRCSAGALCEKIEMGLKQGRSSEPGKDKLSEDSIAMLEKTKEELAQILQSSERLGVQTHDTYLEILASRKKLLYVVELSRSRTF